MPAPTTPTVQPWVADSVAVGSYVLGGLDPGRVVTLDANELTLRSIITTGVAAVAGHTLDISGGLAAFNSFNGLTAVFLDAGDGGTTLVFISPASPWTILEVPQPDTGEPPFQYNMDRVYVSGDLTEALFSTWGAAYTGREYPEVSAIDPTDGSLLWTCEQGVDTVLAGGFGGGRWLRVTAVDGGSASVDLMDDTATVLDTVSFTHPADSWAHDRPFSSDPATWSTLCWVQTTATTVTYLGVSLDTGSVVTVLYRVLTFDAGTDTISWLAAEQTLATSWTWGSLDHVHPWATAWDGQLAIGIRMDQFS